MASFAHISRKHWSKQALCLARYLSPLDYLFVLQYNKSEADLLQLLDSATLAAIALLLGCLIMKGTPHLRQANVSIRPLYSPIQAILSRG